MIRSFSLSNFKAFGNEQHVPLRPITLVFGANSSGKSSLLHALLLAHHAFENGSWDANHVELAGDSVQLGGIGNYLHKKEQNTEKAVTLSFDRVLGTDFEPRSTLLAHASEVRVTLNISTIRSGSTMQRSGLQSCQVDIDGARLFLLAPKTDGQMGINLWETDHPLSRRIVARTCERAMVQLSTPKHEEFVRLQIVALHQQAILGDFSFFPSEVIFPAGVKDSDDFSLSSKTTSEERLGMEIGKIFPPIMRDMFADLRRLFSTDLQAIEYLGPLRSYPSRLLSDDEATDPNWRAGGGFAWKVIMQDKDVRSNVNAWLGQECLNTKYSLEVRRLVDEVTIRSQLTKSLADHDTHLIQQVVSREEGAGAISLAEEIGLTHLNVDEYLGSASDLQESLHEQAYDILKDSGLYEEEEDPDQRHEDLEGAASDFIFNEAEEQFWEEIRQHFLDNDPHIPLIAAELSDPAKSAEWMTERLVTAQGIPRLELALMDLRNNTAVTHRDVGIGISQVLPVLVHAYASKNKLIAIEQPEIHLHPALQAELGDLFVESALGENRNHFILETHSEHLILRLLRRIRETTEGELEEGKRGLRPSDISVLFVEPTDQGSRVIELPVTAAGDFRVPWPGGFFAERATEIFGPSSKEATE